MTGPSIRGLTRADIPRAALLLHAAFTAQSNFAARLERYLAIEPDGWFAAIDGDDLVGMVGAIRYERFAYIGLMGVDPARQGRGIGRRVLEHALAWLDDQGIHCAMLEATPMGAPLYEQLGFVDRPPCTELRAPDAPPAPPPFAATDAATIDEVIALDRTLFGAARAAMWRWFAASGDPILVARGDDGRIAGYLCAQPTMLGPWGAVSHAAAGDLLARARLLPSDTPRRVQVPGENAAGIAMLIAAGFTVTRTLRHMRRGDLGAAPGWGAIYGKASFCLG